MAVSGNSLVSHNGMGRVEAKAAAQQPGTCRTPPLVALSGPGVSHSREEEPWQDHARKIGQKSVV